MTISLYLYIHSAVIGSTNNRKLMVPITLNKGILKVETKALIDSGAEGEFIDQNFT